MSPNLGEKRSCCCAKRELYPLVFAYDSNSIVMKRYCLYHVIYLNTTWFCKVGGVGRQRNLYTDMILMPLVSSIKAKQDVKIFSGILVCFVLI